MIKSIAGSQKLLRGFSTNKLIYAITEDHYKACVLPF